ncbi:transmembrane protein, putative (macronuclear) [Tetrahymena thermophila SB210]|uniref:Transmembrane protein, putative n=1 Tax=Tetrahymena thermophila (strain SB210) TaxID=312017 RepID=W7XL68_TETTS|nr:transmembrane protein, putative [Tetrahymena thermophila SB210]EWS75764.1 transmembrane protein, putative [Tetrahymena thermophila SB210]|eukprot:XP_012651686.1 transmembrane protein, putative [Tetrahymena thermophila SB210]
MIIKLTKQQLIIKSFQFNLLYYSFFIFWPFIYFIVYKSLKNLIISKYFLLILTKFNTIKYPEFNLLFDQDHPLFHINLFCQLFCNLYQAQSILAEPYQWLLLIFNILLTFNSSYQLLQKNQLKYNDYLCIFLQKGSMLPRNIAMLFKIGLFHHIFYLYLSSNLLFQSFYMLCV